MLARDRSKGVAEAKPRRSRGVISPASILSESRNYPNCVHCHIFYLTGIATWGRALSRWKIIASCLVEYQRRFSAIAFFKRINCVRQRSPLWFHPVLATHNAAYPSDPTKYRALPSRYGYSALPLIWLVVRVSHMIFCVGVILMDPFFITSNNPMQK